MSEENTKTPEMSAEDARKVIRGLCESYEAEEKQSILEFKVRVEIERIAHIYPTAFDLYDEPMERLVNGIIGIIKDEACA